MLSCKFYESSQNRFSLWPATSSTYMAIWTFISAATQRCSIRKGVLRNFAKFLRPTTLLKKRLWHRSFPVNFAKFLRTPFLQNTSGRLLLQRLLPSLLYRRQIFAITVRNNPQKEIKNFWSCILFFTSFPCPKHFMWHYNFLCHIKLVNVISLQVLHKQHRVKES